MKKLQNTILLVGAGAMAQEYAKVLQDMELEIIVVGRGETSARAFFDKTGISAHPGGLENWIQKYSGSLPNTAIVCVGERELGSCTIQLIQKGVASILVEKPGGFDSSDIRRVAHEAKKYGSSVYVGYNRRFYESVHTAQNIIHKDGGVLSFIFKFTEWGHKIPETKKQSGETQEWFLANSTHVIDLAFFLGGKPKTISAYATRGVYWHRRASVYAGAGITKGGALFSYHANWESGGRWSVEVMTPKRKLVLKPLEKLISMDIGSVEMRHENIDDALDQKFKPGVYRQVESFFGDKKNLPTIFDQVDMLEWYEKINSPTKP